MNLTLEQLRQEVNSLKSPNQKIHERFFLLDVSDTMRGQKLTLAKEALLKYFKDDDGLIVFGETAYYVNKAELPALMTFGSTAMLPAISMAMTLKARHIIMITDGQPNKGGWVEDVIDYVSHIRGIRIDTIGIGNDCDILFLDRVSKITKGKAIHIQQPEELDGAVQLLAAPKVMIGGM